MRAGERESRVGGKGERSSGDVGWGRRGRREWRGETHTGV